MRTSPSSRLALARYQPQSIEHAHLSRVVMTDFVQLAPDRRTSVTLGAGVAKIEVRGAFGQNRIGDSPPPLEQPEPSTDVWARLEVYDETMGGDLAWKPASDPVELKPVALNGFRATWSGSVDVPESALGAGTHRLLITENERYRRDYEPGARCTPTTPARGAALSSRTCSTSERPTPQSTSEPHVRLTTAPVMARRDPRRRTPRSPRPRRALEGASPAWQWPHGAASI
jgi:hypothetical protein